MKREQAETIALQALSFIARDDERLAQFLLNSALTPHELKKRLLRLLLGRKLPQFQHAVSRQV